jgi:DNA-binding GntR family transcriptional regulator
MKTRSPKRAAAGRRAPTPPRPREDQVAEQIREALLDHRLAPGTKLKEVPLAEVFGVTRNMVRKALLRLAGDRLVELRPNRGAIVASPTVAESRDLYAARRVIECAAVDRLARTITAAQVRALRELAKRESDAYRRGEMRAGLKLSLEFHRTLGRMAGNLVLAEMLEQLMARTPLVVVAYKSGRNDPSCANHEHEDIIDTLAKGNADRAVRTMRDHLDTLEGQLDLREDGPAGTDFAAIFAPARVAR